MSLIRAGKRVIISAYGNSIRALVKYVDDVSDVDIAGLNIPTGIPLIYELDESLKPIKNYYLGDPDEIKRATETVARQGKASYFSSLYAILCGMNFEDT